MPAAVTQLKVIAPLSGVLVPLETVPDPVFAQKMVGDGVSLDPTSGTLLAPVDGVVTQIHSANHAVTLTTPEGIEILLHIGIDTVMLKGEGFFPHVKQGDEVKCGQPLIDFDIDLVARKARSLLTQILVANVEKVARLVPAEGFVEAGEGVAMTLEIGQAAATKVADGGAEVVGDEVSLPNPAGLHARPAAVFVTGAKKFVSEISVLRGADSANAKSVVALLGLSTKHGDLLRVRAVGADADEAVRTLSKLLADGCGEKPGDAPEPTQEAQVKPAVATSADDLAGVSASPGLAVGRIVQYRPQTIEVSERGESPARELAKLSAALGEANRQLSEFKERFNDPAKVQIIEAHQALLEDPELIAASQAGIGRGESAAFAWRAACQSSAAQLEALQGNALLRERANDIRDVGRRVLSLITGIKTEAISVSEGSILIAQELTPSDTASLDPSKVFGFCTVTGGATSHVAILARSLGIPAICGIDDAVLQIEDGTEVVLDGTAGLLHYRPSEADIAVARERVERQAQQREDEKASAMEPAVTTDGHRIEVVANVRNAQEARDGVTLGAEGVGLLRSEFLFDERETAPDEEEQAAEYVAVAQALGPERSLVIRTLDVGGDKPLAYLPMPKEDNPFLGLRGLRVSLENPAMFRAQLRAILRTARLTRLHIMFPMVATLDEWRKAKATVDAILAEEHLAAGRVDVHVGLMIEVPSAALMAERFARESDFFSIGTNDLTQYVLAMDRGHPKLASKADGLNPAVLRTISLACEGAHKHGKWVGVCGGMASDPLAVPVLIGLGVDELSVSVPAVPTIKSLVRRLSLKDCQELAQEILQMGTATEVRACLQAFAA